MCYLAVLDTSTIKDSKAIAIDYADAAIGGSAARSLAAVLVDSPVGQTLSWFAGWNVSFRCS